MPSVCSERWADHLRELGLGPWDAVYGSEEYVEPFAAALQAMSVMVDRDRRAHPISASMIRADLASTWRHLHPAVRIGLTRRIVIVGAESTGTTTLAAALADVLGVPWVPEYGRELSRLKAEEYGSIWDVVWTSEDFDLVAEAQHQLEADAIERQAEDDDAVIPAAGPLVVCDTDALATAVWHRRYCGATAVRIAERAIRRPPLRYVLTTPDGVPFEQDGLRDGEEIRDEMTQWFRDELAAQPAAWIEVAGGVDARVAVVLDALRTVPPVLFSPS